MKKRITCLITVLFFYFPHFIGLWFYGMAYTYGLHLFPPHFIGVYTFYMVYAMVYGIMVYILYFLWPTFLYDLATVCGYMVYFFYGLHFI